jgi:putative ABC transport system permease protein
VLRNASIADRRKIIEDHLVVIVTFLILMSLLIVGVSGLGLMTTMSINVLERTREISVMRAIGASNQAVLRIIIMEGTLAGLLSWLLTLALAWPISIVIGNTFEMILLQATLEFVFAPLGLALWLAIVIVFAEADGTASANGLAFCSGLFGSA